MLSLPKQANETVRESEERLRKMADAAPVMIWASGPDKLCTFFNTSWLIFTGRTMEQECGNGWAGGVHPADLDGCVAHYCSSFDARQNFQMEYRLRRADGQFRWIVDHGVPRFEPGGVFAGYIGSCIDITDIWRAREEDLAREKPERIGVLAEGVAHDFNNLVGAILAEAATAAHLRAGAVPSDGIPRVSRVADRCAEIVRHLTIYAGQDKVDPVGPLDLSKLVEEMLGLLRVSISKHAELKADLAQNLPAIGGGASRIRQIIMNVILNASEAIEEAGGEIKITTSRLVLSGNPGRDHPRQLPAGDYISLEVSDTGGGMSEVVQAKVFDPFFTTKFTGRGLGLSVVQRIVRDQGGAIDLTSAPGKGSTFRIVLPCIGSWPPANFAALTPGYETQQRPLLGTVLIVEDEDVLRLATSRMLQRNGFQVIQAREGLSALALIRGHPDEIDVMLLDITLPGISGREVFVEAKKLRPSLKVILTSAYNREAIHASFAGLPAAGFIRKPFRLAELVSLLGEALSA